MNEERTLKAQKVAKRNEKARGLNSNSERWKTKSSPASSSPMKLH